MGNDQIRCVSYYCVIEFCCIFRKTSFFFESVFDGLIIIRQRHTWFIIQCTHLFIRSPYVTKWYT